MTARFEFEKIPSQKGRIAIVTGANIGLGYETALAFAQKDLKVIMACRNTQKGEQAKKQILEQAPGADLEVMELDLSRMASVRSFSENFLRQYDRLDLLVNNAGIMMTPYSETEDGFELQFATNYLGHFLLTGLLIDTIFKTPESRVVSLSSGAHKFGKINFDDLHGRKDYSPTAAYGQSKLACLMFAYELQRRIDKSGAGTLSLAAHPGVSWTNLMQHLPKLVQKIGPALAPIFSHPPKDGAEPTLLAALGNGVRGGEYFGPDGWQEMKGRAARVDSNSLSKNENIAKRLWEVSEDLTRVRYL